MNNRQIYVEALDNIILASEWDDITVRDEDIELTKDLLNAYDILHQVYDDVMDAVKEGYKRGLNSDTETFEGGKFHAYRYVLDFIQDKLHEKNIDWSDTNEN